MSFLTPLFFVGLGAIVVPILVHLIQRERKRVVEFPSLMFVQRIPYQSVRRRRIRHWFLLLMRAAAIALFVAAFARPFFPQRAAAMAAAGGSREIVILLDQSASMGYGDHWERAKSAARDAIRSIGVNDRASLVLFARNAEESLRATSDRGRLEAAVNTARVISASTRYGPALQLAESILAQSTLPRREVILISDFQKSGWTGAEEINFGENVQLTPVSIASEATTNLSVPSVTFARSAFSGQERITLTAGIANKSADPADRVPVSLDIEGHQLETVSISVAPNASASVAFAPFTLAEPAVRGTVRAGSDPLGADNVFHFVITPGKPISVLVIDSGNARNSSFYLSKALSIGNAPAFQTEIVPTSRATSAMLDKSAVVILNDAMVPLGIPRDVLRRYVERGGGLLVVLGQQSSWPTTEADLLPGKIGAVVDRSSGRGATLGLDYSHQAFEVFKAPRSGDFSAARVLRYRALETGPQDRVLARFDDGAVAAAERRVGTGRVVVWSTSLDDSWNDLALKPVYLPLVHQLVKYLAQYEQPTAWQTVGQVVDLSSLLKGRADRVVVTPATERVTVPSNEPGLLELNEQGVYEIRSASAPSARPDRIAVNLDPAESDLAPLDPQELVAAVTGRAGPGAGERQAPAEMTAVEAERQQGLWWYLLLAGMALLAAETAIANHLSRKERFL
jgi:hypothetical protein